MNKFGSLLTGIAAGAGLTYLLDPERGNRRRAYLRDQAVEAAHDTGDLLGEASRDLQNRTRGVVAETRSRVKHEQVDDTVLVERVRAKLGRYVSHPHAIEVTADNGVVTLRGPILEHEVDDMLKAIRSVRGVQEVQNLTEAHKTPGDVPGLQGGKVRPGERMELMQENWAPGPRVLVGTAGAALAALGLKTRGLTGTIAAAIGSGALARAVTNIEMQRLLGYGGGRKAVDLHKTINVNAPVEEVFRFWSNFANFPRFMTHLKEVRDHGNGRSHWVAEGPAGSEVSWDAVITRYEENKLIAWKSTEGSFIANAGIVRFDRNPDGSTRIDIRLSYNPPAGATGHAIATLFRRNPKQEMDDDLVRFKSLIEEGKTTAHDERVLREEVAPRSTQEENLPTNYTAQPPANPGPLNTGQ